MREVDGGEKKIIIVATNVVASQPPEHRPTGTPTSHANTDLAVFIDSQKCLHIFPPM